MNSFKGGCPSPSVVQRHDLHSNVQYCCNITIEVDSTNEAKFLPPHATTAHSKDTLCWHYYSDMPPRLVFSNRLQTHYVKEQHEVEGFFFSNKYLTVRHVFAFNPFSSNNEILDKLLLLIVICELNLPVYKHMDSSYYKVQLNASSTQKILPCLLILIPLKSSWGEKNPSSSQYKILSSWEKDKTRFWGRFRPTFLFYMNSVKVYKW